MPTFLLNSSILERITLATVKPLLFGRECLRLHNADDFLLVSMLPRGNADGSTYITWYGFPRRSVGTRNDITLDTLVNNGFDHNNIDASELAHPAETLGNIYKSVGKGYSKNKRQVQRTIDALSYEELYINTRKKSPSLNNYIISLEKGLDL